MNAPFRQLRYDEIPELPRRTHPYFETREREVAMQSRAFGDLRIHVREYGEGPPLLLVHGLMSTSYSWRYVIAELGKRFRLIFPDMPGCGKSDKPVARYDAASLATWIGEFVDAMGIRGCAAVGNSLGGFLCMNLALKDERAFSRLVNIHSPAFPEPRLYALHAALKTPGVAAILSRVVRRDPLRWAHRNVHYFDETLKSHEEARAYGEPLRTAAGVAGFIRHLTDAVAPSGFATLVKALEARHAERRPFPVPLLLAYATFDPIVRASDGERLHRLIAGSEFVWLKDTSHFPQVDTPDALLAVIVPFLETRA
jgi:pimeloyl-ACP methyl ester carboxylesterase